MNLDITTYDIKVPNYYDFKTNILVLSDIHDRNYELLENVIDKLLFDVIFIPGDLCVNHISSSYHCVNSSKEYRASLNGLKFLEYCAKRCKIYYSLGNHEWMFDSNDINAINNTGCQFLNDEFLRVSDNAYVARLSSSLKYIKNGIIPEYHNPNLEWLDEYERVEGYKFLLCHHPEYYEKYIKNRDIDLIISGHAHGGQIRIGNQGLYAPGQGLFPKYTSGFIDNKMIISRGLANTVRIIPRINNKPEIVILRLI